MIRYLRAKRIIDNAWVYGYAAKINICGTETCVIYDKKDGSTCYEVDKNTLCTSFGVCVNGQIVYCGDIVTTVDDSCGILKYDETNLQYVISFDTNDITTMHITKQDIKCILGNIFDDPFLLSKLHKSVNRASNSSAIYNPNSTATWVAKSTATQMHDPYLDNSDGWSISNNVKYDAKLDAPLNLVQEIKDNTLKEKNK